MRPDQIQRLNDLSERLADTFIDEAEPAEWPGHGEKMASITAQQRGDRYWCKKNAMATAGVLRYAIDLVQSHQGRGHPGDAERDADLDRKINEAERRASVAVARVLNKAAGKDEQLTAG